MADDQHRVWEAIGASFDRTRTRPWRHVVEFIEALPAGSRVLDLMAGNGRHTKVLLDAGHHAMAADWSRPLCRILASRFPQADVVAADAVALPLADASMDACIYVAGLHGIATPEGRLASLAELRRVLKPGAAAQVSVWSRNAPRFAGVPQARSDVEVPWKADGLAEKRWYHLFTATTLSANAAAAGLQVRSVVEDGENLVAELRR